MKTSNTKIAAAVLVATILLWIAGLSQRGRAQQTQQRSAANTCPVIPFPSTLTYVGGLNDGSQFSNGLGNALRVQRMTLGTTDVLVVAVGQNGNGSGMLEVYFVDPNTGALLDGTSIGSVTEVQPHISAYVGVSIRSISGGDVNGDGIPDFALGSPAGAAFALVGIVSNGVLSYQVFTLPAPSNTNGFGASTAMGDLDGLPGDEIAIGATGGGQGAKATVGKVVIFTFNGLTFTNTQNISSPIANSNFGSALTIRNVTGSSANDLIAGASGSTVNGASGAGAILVFPGPVNASNYQTLTTGIKGDQFGASVVAGNVDGGVSDVIGATSNSTNSRANVYSGATSSGESPSFTLYPISGLSGLWSVGDSGDLNGDGLDDVIAGAATGCGGTAYVYLSGGGLPLTTRLAFQTPVAGTTKFGSSVAIAPGSRLLFVGDSLITVGSTFAYNGQVHVFRLN